MAERKEGHASSFKAKKRGKLASVALTTAMTLGSVAGMESSAHAKEQAPTAKVEKKKPQKAPESRAEADQETNNGPLERLRRVTDADFPKAIEGRIEDARAAAQERAGSFAEKIKKDFGVDDASVKAYGEQQEQDRAERKRHPKKLGRTATALKGIVDWFFGSEEQPKDQNEKPAK